MRWVVFAPEIYYFCAGAVFFLLSFSARPQPRRDHLVALSAAVLGIVVTFASITSQSTLCAEAYRADLYSQVFKALLAVGLFLVLCLCSELKGIEKTRHAEFYLLLMVCTLGTMMLVSSAELITLYVALEVTSYSLYILVALRADYAQSAETGLKYFLIGAVTSAVMLFGMALLYGATGTTYMADIRQAFLSVPGAAMASVGLLLTLSAFFFKLALFPFHIWAPTVYQGATNQVTAYIATVTKVAAIALTIRIVALGAGAAMPMTRILVVLAIASMTLGNLTAIVQKDIKRLLAYSAIAHAGYVLVGILSMSESGYAGAVFYALAYLVLSFTCFLVIVKVAQDGNNLDISQLAGLHRRSPLLAAALMLGVFGLGGIPPTIGFTGKFFVFTAAMESGYFFLVIISMINVVISLYYYALIVKAAYILKPEGEPVPIKLSVGTRLLTLGMVSVMIAGGIFPGQLYGLARAAARALV
jgi:NADH-quinone oxidoreductase subunit N